MKNISEHVATITLLSLKRSGHVVTLSCGINLKDTVKTGDKLFTIPNGFCPNKGLYVPMTDVNGYTENILLSINTNGNCNIVANNITNVSTTWIYLATSFIVD